IMRLVELGTYRGMRNRSGLPVHGQRIHTNARNRKEPRRPAATLKKYSRTTQMAKASTGSSSRARKRIRKSVSDDIAHVHASFNNTIITITDRQGNALA